MCFAVKRLTRERLRWMKERIHISEKVLGYDAHTPGREEKEHAVEDAGKDLVIC